MINTALIPKAYSEVYSFLNALGPDYIKKIPSSVYNTIKVNRDSNYNPTFNNNQTMTKGMISQEALSLIAALNLQYWCKDPEEKARLKEAYYRNTKLEEEKYSYENLFKNNKQQEVIENTTEKITEETTALVEYKESFLTKIINKIKNIFGFIYKK